MGHKARRGGAGARAGAGKRAARSAAGREPDCGPERRPDPADGSGSDTSQLDRICLFNLLSASADTIFFKDLESRFIRVSQSQADLTGARSPDAMVGKSDFDYFSPEHAAEARAYERQIIRTGESMTDLREWNIRVGDHGRVLSSTKQPLRDFSGRIIGTFGISRDITARQSTERELLAKTEELDRVGRELRTVLDSSPDPMVRVDRELRYTYVNPAAAALAGTPVDEMLGRTSREVGQSSEYLREWEKALRQVLDTGQGAEAERNLVLAGTRRFLLSRLVPEFDESGAVTSVLVVSHDLTDRKRIEDALADQAVRDPLTRLANRLLLVRQADLALARLRGRPGQLAVFFLDLDRFKVVNDSLGHAAGDALLVAVAQRLRATARRNDLVARFGGDEFAILSEQLDSPADAAALARRISRALAAPFRHAGQELHVSASIGIALTGDPETSSETLLRDADAAMYQVKAWRRGTGGYEFFTPEIRRRAVSRLVVEAQLRLAVERGEFRLVYEPVYALRERRLVGMEALIRWQHPQRGLLAPAEFIGVAEDCDLIFPIGAWVLDEACRTLAGWNRPPAAGAPALSMAVNLSARQISDPGLVGQVADVLRRHGLDPGQLCLEITETAVHDAPLSANAVLSGLSELGVRIALDDFGTGYSSLRHLRRIKVDILKIDRMFVDGLDRPGEDQAIVAAVTAMARALGMTTIGEGIETAAQYDQLVELGCDQGQGYLLSHPLPPDQFARTFLDRADG